jgi:hypothetical protein
MIVNIYNTADDIRHADITPDELIAAVQSILIRKNGWGPVARAINEAELTVTVTP